MAQLRPTIYRSIPWILFGVVLMPAVATTAVGILVLVLSDVPGAIALGILTICFAVFALAGTFVTLGLLHRQNRLVRMQTEFIANVSHELRTPLAAIRMYVETLHLGRVSSPEESEECLQSLERETERLSALVEQLLQARASESGLSGEDTRDVADIGTLVESVTRRFKERPNHGERISVVVEPALPLAQVSEDGFDEALSNLLQNALTHGGDSGPIVVTARAAHEGVAVDVRDSGPGIPPRDQKRIFERFFRAQKSTNSHVPGFGLGLSIVRRFASDHGGQVKVKSAPGNGAIFTIWLPTPTGKLRKSGGTRSASRSAASAGPAS